MKQEERNALSRAKILDAALREFSAQGYDGTSMNTICSQYSISKGIIYHYFEDKDSLYLLCVKQCFDDFTAHLSRASDGLTGTLEQRLQGYFTARFRFFTENPLYLGIFADASFRTPGHLSQKIRQCRENFDALNISILTGFLSQVSLREELSISDVVEDFRMYVDYFNARFQAGFSEGTSAEIVLRQHEQMCRRQLRILLYGVLRDREQP